MQFIDDDRFSSEAGTESIFSLWFYFQWALTFFEDRDYIFIQFLQFLACGWC